MYGILKCTWMRFSLLSAAAAAATAAPPYCAMAALAAVVDVAGAGAADDDVDVDTITLFMPVVRPSMTTSNDLQKQNQARWLSMCSVRFVCSHVAALPAPLQYMHHYASVYSRQRPVKSN